MTKSIKQHESRKKGVQTATLAERFDYTPQTIRKHLSQKGHFFGLVPRKMPNGRNSWPDVFPSDVSEV
jgi:hypothetical protein